MLYSMAIEPLLHKLKQAFKLSAYADDVVVIVKIQDDIDVLLKLLMCLFVLPGELR